MKQLLLIILTTFSMWSCVPSERGYLKADTLCNMSQADIQDYMGGSTAVIRGVVTRVRGENSHDSLKSVVTIENDSAHCLVAAYFLIPTHKARYWGFVPELVGLKKSIALRDMDSVQKIVFPNGKIGIYFNGVYDSNYNFGGDI